jgi:hypothetical protein
MSTPNRQIGWSQESNLLSYISKQLDKLNGVVAATAAGGMLNPSTDYIPYNSGLAFGDSFLVNDATNSILKTVYSASDVGLKLDFANNNYRLGDYDASNGSYVEVDGWNIYLKGSNNNTWFEIDDNNSTIKSTYGNNDIGLNLDFANEIFKISNLAETYKVQVSPNDDEVSMFASTGGIGSSIYVTDSSASMRSQATQLLIDGSNQRLTLSSNLEAAAAGASSGKFLKVRIGLTDYKIALLNNA